MLKNKATAQQTACRNGWLTASFEHFLLNLMYHLRLTFSDGNQPLRQAAKR